jgi:hypothetical protein
MQPPNGWVHVSPRSQILQPQRDPITHVAAGALHLLFISEGSRVWAAGSSVHIPRPLQFQPATEQGVAAAGPPQAAVHHVPVHVPLSPTRRPSPLQTTKEARSYVAGSTQVLCPVRTFWHLCGVVIS